MKLIILEIERGDGSSQCTGVELGFFVYKEF